MREKVSQEMFDLALSAILPDLTALQNQFAELTATFLNKRLGGRPRSVHYDLVTTPVDELTSELVKPFITTRRLLKEGQTLDQALQKASTDLERIISTQAELAKIRQGQSSLLDAGVGRFKRVADGESPCALCLIASTRVYYTENLLPIHTNCQCDIDIIQPGDITVVDGKEYVGLETLKIPDELLMIGPRADPNSMRTRLKGYLQDLDKRQFQAGVQAWEQTIHVAHPMARNEAPSLEYKPRSAATPAKKPATKTVEPPAFTPASGVITEDMSWTESLDAFKSEYPDIKLVGWNKNIVNAVNSDSDAARIHKDWFQGISDVLARYPEVAPYITEIRLEPIGTAFAHVQPVVGTQGRKSIITFEKESVILPSRFADDMKHLEDIGHSFPNSAERPGYSTAIHEMGHVLDNFSFETVTYSLQDELPAMFLETKGYDVRDMTTDPMAWKDSVYREWGQFLEGNMSSYSFDPQVVEPQLNPPEALAEAFADAWINGDSASPTSKKIVSLLERSIESANRYDAR